MIEYEVKYYACGLCNSLHRNINDNFQSVSFEIQENKNVQVRVVLETITEVEEELIDDMIAEFSAAQETDCILSPQVFSGVEISPLENLVYRKGN